jgi:tetratricopeptide (TPR) repeat protein
MAMKKISLILAVSAMALPIIIQPGLAFNPNDPIRDEVVYRPSDDVLLMMSYTQARKIIESFENHRQKIPPGYTADTYNTPLYTDIKIDPDKITWNERYPALFWACTAYFGSMDPHVEKSHVYGTFYVLLCEAAPRRHGCVKEVEHGGQNTTSATDKFWNSLERNEAVSLAAAFYVLKRYAEGYKPEDEEALFADFQQKAKAWRVLTVKPALPEDVQRCRVMAEDAFNNKDFEKALKYYKKGLAIEPLWPQGQFNAALLEGELHCFKSAAIHMKSYLELAPDAANAKVAREKMYLWEEKAREEAQMLTETGE